MEQNKVRTYSFYALAEIPLYVLENTCPVRDYLSVETMNSPNAHRAVRYGIRKNSNMVSKHIAYQPVGGRIEIDSLPGKGTKFMIHPEKHGQDGF